MGVCLLLLLAALRQLLISQQQGSLVQWYTQGTAL